jgi:8-oxo-dGTP diphosphatase
MGLYTKEPRDFRKKFDVVGVFLNYKDKMLLLKRQPHKLEGGFYGVPAGKSKVGEKLLDAAARELKEETGITLATEKIQFFKSVFVRYADKFPDGPDLIFHMYTASLTKEPEIVLSEEEHSEYVWATPHEALGMSLMYEEDKCISMIYFPPEF